MHKIESIMASLVSALSSAMSSILVERTPVYKADQTRILVRQGQETTDQEGVLTDASFELIITQVVLSQSDQLEAIANDHRSTVHKTLMALQGTIDGMLDVSSLRVGESEINAELPSLSRELVYQIRYRYNTGDPSL